MQLFIFWQKTPLKSERISKRKQSWGQARRAFAQSLTRAVQKRRDECGRAPVLKPDAYPMRPTLRVIQ
jgi:hypothetical protein